MRRFGHKSKGYRWMEDIEMEDESKKAVKRARERERERERSF